MGLNENTLNEIEQEMVCYLINVDEMNYTMLCEPVALESKSNTMSEIEMQRACYLLNVDDMNYTMLCEPLITRYRSAIAPDRSKIGGLEKLSLVSGLACIEDSQGYMELFDNQSQIEFTKRKIQTLRPATLEDEIAESSY